MKRFNWLLIVLALSAITLNAAAATFTLIPTVVGRLDDSFSPLPFDPLAGGSILDGAGYYQIDFDFTITDLAPDERGFAATAFDLTLTGGLLDTLGAGWSPYSGNLVTQNGPLIGSSSQYFVNTDAGQDHLDLQSIVAATAPRLDASDPRTTLGQNGAAKLGSVYLYWDGTTYSSLSTSDITFAVSNTSGQTVVAPGTAATAVLEFGLPGPNDVRPVPQPAFVPPPPPVAPPDLPPLPNPGQPPVVPPVHPPLPDPVQPPLPPPDMPLPPNPGPPQANPPDFPPSLGPVEPPVAPPGVPPQLPGPHASNATFTLTPKVVARFDESFAELPFDASAEGSIIGGPGYYKIDLSFTVGDLLPEEHGFMATAFDLKITGGLTDSGSGWSPYADGSDTPDDSFRGSSSQYFINTDAGSDSLDLQSIVASIAPHLDPSDPRTTLGQESAAPLGSVYLYWDGSTYSSLSTSDISFAVSSTLGQTIVVPGTAAGAVVEFGIPEPGIERVQPEPATRPTVEPPALEVPPLEGPPPLPNVVDLGPTVLPPTVEDPIDPPPAIPDPQPPVPGPDGDDPPPINTPPDDPAEWVFVRPFPFPGSVIDPIGWTPNVWQIRNGEFDLTEMITFPGTVVTTIDDTGIVFVGDIPTDAEPFAFGLPVLQSQPHTLQQFVQTHTNFFLGLNGQGAQFGSGHIGAPEPSSALLATLAMLSLPAFARRRGSLLVRPIADSR